MRHDDYHMAFLVPLFDVSVRFDHLFQGMASVAKSVHSAVCVFALASGSNSFYVGSLELR